MQFVILFLQTKPKDESIRRPAIVTRHLVDEIKRLAN
jgi:hypothetical protein